MSSRLLFSILICFLAMSPVAQSQGSNNEYEIDQVDLNHALDILGLEVYKFPITTNQSNTYANVIIEHYEDGKLIESENFYQTIKPILDMLDEPLEKKIQKLGNQEKWIRFYVHENDTSLDIYTVNGNTKKTSSFSLQDFNLTGSRAFGKIPGNLPQKMRVLTFYANRESNLISCPGDATPEEIASLYDFAIIAYLEPLQVE